MGRDEVAAALEARRISKSFGGTRALERVGIVVERGELHGLVGANGSGKSTLVRVLAGYHAPAPGGSLTVAGRAVDLPLPPGRPRELGLRFVHQDLGLIPSLSAVENLRLDELAAARRRWISWSRERARARASFARFGVEIDPRAPVEQLTPVERALLAIVRAAEDAPTVLVLDEPTAYLPGPERRRVHALLREIAGRGAGVLLVSHDLNEVRELTDRVTVLREGRNAGTLDAGAAEPRELAELMVGVGFESRPRSPARGRDTVSIVGLTGETVRDLSLKVRRGEVLGLTGLTGSGFDEPPYLLFGARRARGGNLATSEGEHDLTEMTPLRAIEAGIALLPADRARDGAVGSLGVGDNVVLPVLDRYRRALGLDRGRLVRDAAALLRDHGVSPDEPGAAFEALSGGNQQKALVAKWLQTAPSLLLLDEPLRGVDVGARRQLVERIRGLAALGAAVLCASADGEQLDELCDRVLVLEDGKVVGEEWSPSA